MGRSAARDAVLPQWRPRKRLASQEKLLKRAGSSTLRDGRSKQVCHAAVREPAAALAALDVQRE